jgi:hypothetical protein
MNIKNRLDKLETEIIGNDSEFCACNGLEQQVDFQLRTIEYDAYSTGEYVAYQHSETSKRIGLESEAEPPTIENCQTCGKPINQRVIVIELVK